MIRVLKITKDVFIRIQCALAATRGQSNVPSSHPTQLYLLLCQLLLESLAVADGHSLNLLLPLPRLSEPADEPLVASVVGVHVAAEEVELPLPQLQLSEHCLPALQEAADQLAVVLHLGVALAVDPRHLVVDGRRPLQLVLQPVEHDLVGLRLRAHRLMKGQSRQLNVRAAGDRFIYMSDFLTSQVPSADCDDPPPPSHPPALC